MLPITVSKSEHFNRHCSQSPKLELYRRVVAMHNFSQHFTLSSAYQFDCFITEPRYISGYIKSIFLAEKKVIHIANSPQAEEPPSVIGALLLLAVGSKWLNNWYYADRLSWNFTLVVGAAAAWREKTVQNKRQRRRRSLHGRLAGWRQSSTNRRSFLPLR